MPRGKKRTHEDFVNIVKEKTGDEFYVIGKYIEAHKKIEIRHNICGSLLNISPSNFLNNLKCKNCSNKNKSERMAFSKDEFVNKLNELFEGEYTLLNQYVNANTKIKIKHEKCGNIYETRPSVLINRKSGCPECGRLKSDKNRRKTHQEFLEEIKNLTDADEYSFLDDYAGCTKKIEVLHHNCGNTYYVSPDRFLGGRRCPKCSLKVSRGAKRIEKWLKDRNLNYDTEISFEDCRHKLPLYFDFIVYNSDNTVNCIIEYDGEQHFKPVDRFGGEKSFLESQTRDRIKDEYCKNNNLSLLRIPYWVKEVEELLSNELG